jgi:hypothetical protein
MLSKLKMERYGFTIENLSECESNHNQRAEATPAL